MNLAPEAQKIVPAAFPCFRLEKMLAHLGHKEPTASRHLGHLLLSLQRLCHMYPPLLFLVVLTKLCHLLWCHAPRLLCCECRKGCGRLSAERHCSKQ